MEHFYNIFFSNSSFEKKFDKSKFPLSALLFKLFFKIKIRPKKNEQKEKRKGFYDLLNAETKTKFICLSYKRKDNFTEKVLFEEKGTGRIKQKPKEGFLPTLATGIKMNPQRQR